MFYVLTKQKESKEISSIERLDEKEWELKKKYQEPGYDYYATTNIADKKLQESGVKEIVWKMLWNPKYSIFEELKIAYTPKNIEAMEKEAEQKIKENEKRMQDFIDNKNKN